MGERFEIIEGEGRTDPLLQLLRVGGVIIGFAKKSAKMGVLITAEIGNSVMYPVGQRGYARSLKLREPRDRAARELKTALRAFAGQGNKPEELSTHAALDFAAANLQLQKVDPDTAIENTPAVVTLIEKIPDTQDGARVAEQVAAHGLAAVVDDFNTHVLHLPSPIPPQPGPVD